MPFNYHSKGGSLSFWIGQKFPRVSLCFIFGLGNKRIGFFACEVQISINGQKASNREQYFLSVSGDLVWLYHQENLMDLNTYLLHEQNHVEVSCEIIDASKAAEVTIYCCGVHEYKEDEEVEKPNLILCNDYLDNTQFSRETHDNQCHYEDDFAIECCSLPENLRLDEISDEQMQQPFASTNLEMLECNGCTIQKKEKATDVISDDTIHQNKELFPLHLHLYGDRIWDPMLLECQLNHQNENQLLPIDCHTSENKGKIERYLTQLGTGSTKLIIYFR